MEPSQKLRLWVKEAPATEVRLTAIVVIICIGLVAWALVPPHSHSQLTVGAGATERPQGGGIAATQADSAAVGSASAGSTGEPGSGPAINGASASGTVTGARAASSSSVPGGGGQPSGPLSATDRGVTANGIKVAFFLFNLAPGGLAASAFSFRNDERQAVEAFVDYVNKQGGVLGRKIIPIIENPNLVDSNDARAKCLDATQTNQVFVVIDGVALGLAMDCVMNENKTLLINEGRSDAKTEARWFPKHLQFSNNQSADAKQWVFGGRDTGFFDAKNGFVKLGLYSASCDAVMWDDPQIGVKAYLKQIGITSWSEYRSDCSAEAIESGHTAALLKHRQDGVTNLMMSLTLADRNYTTAAQQQGYHPKYLWEDSGYATFNYEADQMQQDQIDGSYGITARVNNVDPTKYSATNPEAAKCSKILTDHGLAPITSVDADLNVLWQCEHLDFFVQIARTAGPNLTQKSFTDAAQQFAAFRPALEIQTHFKPGDLVGGDEITFARWKKLKGGTGVGAGEWIPGDLRPAY